MRKVTHEEMSEDYNLLIANTKENIAFLESKGYEKSGDYEVKEKYLCVFSYSNTIVSLSKIDYLDTLCELIKEEK